MALEVLKETTVWKVDFRQPNHVYLMDGSKVLAYKKWGEGEAIWFKEPGKFDKRRRTFQKLKLDDTFKRPDTL